MGKAQVIPFGPQHPVLPEPLHLDLVVQDETVVDVLPQIGFVHRGLEKLVETRDIHQYIYVAERICGICAFGHSYGYAQTVETMMNVEVPERAEYLRTIMHELSRIHSHLLWMGLAADAFGYEALFMHCWRLRERILDIFESVAGGRVILSYTLLGGVTKDIEAPTLATIKDTLNSLKKEYSEICNAFLKDSSVKNRTVGVGFIDEAHAREYGMVGPFARASNVNNDVRCLGHRRLRQAFLFRAHHGYSGRLLCTHQSACQGSAAVHRHRQRAHRQDSRWAHPQPREGRTGGWRRSCLHP